MNIPCSLPLKKDNEQGDFYVQHTLGLSDLRVYGLLPKQAVKSQNNELRRAGLAYLIISFYPH